MKKMFLVFLLFCLNANADPFYPDEVREQTEESAKSSHGNDNPNEPFAKNPEISTACMPLENVNEVNIPTDFHTLNFIGIIQVDDLFKALFIDKDNMLIELKTGDFITSAKIEVIDINLKKITYIDWQKTSNCTKPYKIERKL